MSIGQLMKRSIKSDGVASWIKDQIALGKWSLGMKIPSQRVLAEDLSVNRSTVIAALEQLKADGIIEGVMGKGTIVANNTWSLLASLPPDNKPASQTAHTGIIDLSKGELAEDVFPENYLNDILSRVSGKINSLGYEDRGGYEPLREAIAGYMTRQGTPVTPSSILIVSGAMQGFQLIASGLLEHHSSILLEEPSYLYSIHTFQSLGMSLKGIQMDHEGLRPELLQSAWTSGQKGALYTIPCFHNPTGILMSEARRKEILSYCSSNRLPIIEDDIYRDLWLDAPPPPSLKSMDSSGNVLYIGSLSKTLSPGLRIGWIAGTDSVIERLSNVKMQADYGTSSLSQRVAAEWLGEGLYEHHLEYVRKELLKRRQAASASLQRHLSDLAEWTIPSGGFFIWLRLNQNISLKELYTEALNEGILFHPGSIYTEGTSRAIRLSFGYAPPDQFEEGIKRMKKWIIALSK
ncbi:PLP-dependent aminotransferase family protein [Domibacillus sp. A3M-37]|uniref:aminotransferase-like domain-containing protein n=1 Tax=Domibacillus sp. A3M-37 TaxID=2962037 RepID=UPI0020B7B42E|nr:PLP-dependent aminotransferase family protein [Domibacillus sp. A3M-37]MCP3762710.1 PLP-dependent aminotransferase family protein [Domibacillus sp. A3M-37]